MKTINSGKCANARGISSSVLAAATSQLRDIALLGEFDHFWPMSLEEAKSLTADTVQMAIWLCE